MNVTYPHNLDINRAKAAVILTIFSLLQNHPEVATTLEQNWENDTMTFSFNFSGKKVTGTCAVTEKNITIQSNLPFPLSVGASLVEDQIRAHAAEYLKLVA